MKKPKVSKSKKGAIFNILWLLVENPTKLDYFKVTDISELLLAEFQINLDRKTIMDYLEILMDLELDFEIAHENKKGYYIKKRLVDDNSRNMLSKLVISQSSIDSNTKNQLLDYISYDLSHDEKLNTNVVLEDTSFNISTNISIIQEAIDKKRNIVFEYLNFNKFGKLMKAKRTYTGIPQAIKYLHGIYYVYFAKNIWHSGFCGIRIKYMRNIKIGDESTEGVLIHEYINYEFKLEIKQEWTIEYLDSFFDDYKIINQKDKTYALVTTSVDHMNLFYKNWGCFFYTEDKELREDLDFTYNLIKTNLSEDEIVRKITASLVDFHYGNNVVELSNYDNYIAKLLSNMDFYLDNIGYKKLDDKIYQNDTKKIRVTLSTYNLINKESKEEEKIINVINSLKEKEYQDYAIILFNDMLEDFENEIIMVSNNNAAFINPHYFSTQTFNYFHKFVVFKINK